jgi:type I restriction-modification system DNA methylase subunit
MTDAYQKISQLAKDFKAQEKAYLSAGYQESQVRQDFIDKFFAALGWDVTHERQKNPYEQEVKIENKVATQGSQRGADYAFFLAPNFRDVKFYVEAKKPARDLSNSDYYHQAIRYGWNTGTPIAMLTDFEEFHVLDCRFKPDIKDALNRKLKYFHYSEYANEQTFAEIFYLFGREAVSNGSIEKFAAELPKPRGKATQRGLFKGGYKSVDEDFLELLDGYRETLAKAFKKENAGLESEELTEAVQRTLDRLVFIRFLEDKGIEEPSIVALRQKSTAWKAFASLCRQFDSRYNGLVFKQHRMLDSKDFVPPDDSTFGQLCDELADPSSPYDFDKIPISILGSIYERFLGKVVHATDKRVKVEEKPEVRKAGGVYYTPEYIVRYIVKETVGKLIDGKTPAEIAIMAFADIACGSGSFLIEVYNRLLDYHARFYNDHRDTANKEDVIEREGKFHLSLKKRKEILVNNVYGVDIDFQATEVTQFSLYLKLLEDVSLQETHQLGMFKETILPDLRGNIVCGNSLIGTDIKGLFADADVEKLKPMNFEDVFPEIMKGGGFDAVVGNPPYVRIQGFPKDQIRYFNKHYHSAIGNYDLYVNFVEKGYSILDTDGTFGMILPNKFFKTDYGSGLRELIAKEQLLRKIVDFGANQVFGVSTYTCLLFLEKRKNNTYEFSRSDAKPSAFESLNFQVKKSSSISKSVWLFEDQNTSSILTRLNTSSMRLLDLPAEMSRGSSSGDDSIFMLSADSKEVDEDILRLPIFATDFKRYSFSPAFQWRIIFPYVKENNHYRLYSEQELQKKHPKTYRYLSRNKSKLQKRKQYKAWYGYSAPRNLELHDQAQIVVPLLADKG